MAIGDVDRPIGRGEHELWIIQPVGTGDGVNYAIGGDFADAVIAGIGDI